MDVDVVWPSGGLVGWFLAQFPMGWLAELDASPVGMEAIAYKVEKHEQHGRKPAATLAIRPRIRPRSIARTSALRSVTRTTRLEYRRRGRSLNTRN